MPDPNAPRLRARRLAALAALLLGVAAPPVPAQEVLQPLANPDLAPVQRGVAKAKTLYALPKGVGPTQREVALDLTVDYIEGTIWNPATGRDDAVKLRGYKGTGTNPKVPFVGPTIEVTPGDTLRMTLRNKLPEDSTCEEAGGSANIPNCFNGTNMHTHGLWVNPAGNGDNVLISINPTVDFQYEYAIPPDHPAGTFWYHPHRHGSTALQVSSGMAGALIVRGDRQPTAEGNGDLDVLLKPFGGQQFAERILVFQQIQYACTGPDGKVLTNKDGTYLCPAGSVGDIESYSLFGPTNWAKSGRYTGINGDIQPIVSQTSVGQVERWRMIHAGVRDTISFQIRKHKSKAQDTRKQLSNLTAAKNDAYIDTYCTGEPLDHVLVAADGLTTARGIPTEVATLQPGYRWDALVTFPEPGDYCVIDTSAPEAGALQGSAPSRRLLGFAIAMPGTNPVPGDTVAYIQQQLVAAALANITTEAKATVAIDLEKGLRLAKFVPHPDIADKDVKGTQEMVFNIDTSQGTPFFEVNGKPYAPGRMDRTLILGSADEWTLSSDFTSHPFHIHVNPFQIVSIEGPKPVGGERPKLGGPNTDAYVMGPDGKVTKTSVADPQYDNMIGVWKDTLWIKNLYPTGKITPTQPLEDYKYIIKVRTRYQRYIGQFVLHCHILDHEDQGMMQNVQIVLPDGQGGASHGHH